MSKALILVVLLYHSADPYIGVGAIEPTGTNTLIFHMTYIV